MNATSPAELCADAATKLWHSLGRAAIFKPADYRKALTELGKKTRDPAAKKSFDATLLAHARDSKQILKPDLPKKKKYQQAVPVEPFMA